MWVLDIETTTDFKTIRMVGLLDTVNNIRHCLKHKDSLIDKLIKAEESGRELLTWNGAAFDIPMLRHLWNVDILKYDITHVDGMLLSKLVDFDHPGGHSLEVYGKKLGYPKGEVDYDEDSDADLWEYLRQDLTITREAYNDILHRAGYRSGHEGRTKYDQALRVEQNVANQVSEQKYRGIPFDRDRAIELVSEIDDLMDEIEAKVNPLLPVWATPKSKLHYPPKVQFKKDGDISKYMDDYLTKYGATYLLGTRKVQGADGKIYTLPLTEPLNKWDKLRLSDQSRLKEYLLSIGWSPSWWNEKKIDGKVKRTTPRLTHIHTREPDPSYSR